MFLASLSAIILTPFGFSRRTVAWRPSSREMLANGEKGGRSEVGGSLQSNGMDCGEEESMELQEIASVSPRIKKRGGGGGGGGG